MINVVWVSVTVTGSVVLIGTLKKARSCLLLVRASSLVWISGGSSNPTEIYYIESQFGEKVGTLKTRKQS